MQRTNQAASRRVVLASVLAILPTSVLTTRPARAQDATSPPAAAFPGTDTPPAPSAPPPAATPPAAPPVDAPSSPPADASPAPTPVAPVPVERAPASIPVAPAPAPPSTGSAAFAPLPEPGRAPSQKPNKPKPAPPPAAAVVTPPLASGQPNPESTSSSEPADQKDDTNGVFGPFRIGFLIGIGLPDLLSLGGTIKLTKYVGFGVNVGIIPTVKLSLYGDATLSYQEYDAYGRIYPFGGGFFLGTGVGYGTIKGTVKNKYTLTPEQTPYFPGSPASVEIDSAGSVRTMVLTPQVGFLKTFASGFSIGADVGAQIPIAPSQVDYQTALPSGVPDSLRQLVSPNDAKVRSTLDTIGRTTLPTINVKVGWLL